MDNEKRPLLGNHPVIVILGVIGSCIAIFAFCTGFQSITQLISNFLNIPISSGNNPIEYPEFQQTNPPPTIDLQGLPSFGDSKDINGLIVTVGEPNYDAGCNRTLEFEVILRNTTDAPIVLGFGSYDDIKLLGNGNNNEKLYSYGEFGALTPRCFGSFEVETIAPNSEIRLSLGTRDSLGEYEYLDLVFGENAGRIAGQIWRLDISRDYVVPITYFGENIDIEGLKVFVGSENYFPNCNGTLEFKIQIHNSTNQPIVLGLRSENYQIYGSNDDDMYFYGGIGQFTGDDCPYYIDEINSIQANEAILISILLRDSFSGLSFIDFVFEGDNRLAGLKWRLNLPR